MEKSTNIDPILDHCKSCLTYNLLKENKTNYINCALKTPFSKDCPCSKCLIKSVCDTECPDYKKFKMWRKIGNTN